MKQKFYETKEFKAEQKKYYKRLKEFGFKDTETLKDIETNNINKQIIKVDFGQVRHFEECSIYLNSGEIKDKFDQFIFELYCEGKSSYEIEPMFNEKFKLKTLSDRAIQMRILRIMKDGGIKPHKFTF